MTQGRVFYRCFQTDHASKGAAGDDHFIQSRVRRMTLSIAPHPGLDHHSLLNGVLPDQEPTNRFIQLVRFNGGQKPDPTQIDGQDGYIQAIKKPRHHKQRAVTAQYNRRFGAVQRLSIMTHLG